MQHHSGIHHAFARYFSKDGLYPFLYQLSQKMAEGNVCLALDELTAEEEAERPDPQVLQTHRLVGDPDAGRPFVLFENRLYLNRFFQYERRFVQQIRFLLAMEPALEAERMAFLAAHRDWIAETLFPPDPGQEAPDWQLIACLNSFVHQCSIITGGPGTGKTTTVARLLSLFLTENPSAKIRICAPTGKATVRLEEGLRKIRAQAPALGLRPELAEAIATIPASTIHRLLGYIPDQIHFRHGQDLPLDADVLIVDECSMVDMALFHKLLQAVDPKRTRLVLLGDKHQLASVDAGSVFRDLCAADQCINRFDPERMAWLNGFIPLAAQQLSSSFLSEKEGHPLCQHIIELQRSYRFDDRQGIGKLSRAVLQHDEEAIRTFAQQPEPVAGIYPAHTQEYWVQQFAQKRTAENGGYIGLSDTVQALSRMTGSIILCAMREGRQGVAAINELVSRSLFHPETEFYEDRLLMVQQNQPEEGIYNGDIGIVRTLTGQDSLQVCFPQSETDYLSLSPAQILACDSAYAMTIHKSQGSEFDAVLIILPEQQTHQLLNRELLYTAITRAKKELIIVGDIETVLAAAAQPVKRISGIQQQFVHV